MASLKSLVNERLVKKHLVPAEPPLTASAGRLKEFFNRAARVETAPILTESSIQDVSNDAIPFLDRTHPNYSKHLDECARIKRDNPTLYAKMLNWD